MLERRREEKRRKRGDGEVGGVRGGEEGGLKGEEGGGVLAKYLVAQTNDRDGI